MSNHPVSTRLRVTSCKPVARQASATKRRRSVLHDVARIVKQHQRAGRRFSLAGIARKLGVHRQTVYVAHNTARLAGLIDDDKSKRPRPPVARCANTGTDGKHEGKNSVHPLLGVVAAFINVNAAKGIRVGGVRVALHVGISRSWATLLCQRARAMGIAKANATSIHARAVQTQEAVVGALWKAMAQGEHVTIEEIAERTNRTRGQVRYALEMLRKQRHPEWRKCKGILQPANQAKRPHGRPRQWTPIDPAIGM